MADGVVLYDGPSTFNNEPIVAIGTNIKRRSNNPKTGWMVQIWFMHRDISPADAALNGADASVCGDCPLRTRIVQTVRGPKQQRPCYVKMFKPVQNIWKAFHRGRYRTITQAQWNDITLKLPARFGAFGDPTALPFGVIRDLAEPARHEHGITGYSHFPLTCDQQFAQYFMASCETLDQQRAAKLAGWRTFRTILSATDVRLERERLCPAPRISCAECLLCDGMRTPLDRRVDIVNPAHGAGKDLFADIVSG